MTSLLAADAMPAMFVELLDCVDRGKEHGLNWIVLVVPREARGRRMKILPGLLGEVIGSTASDTNVSVKLTDIRRWLLRYLEMIEFHAIRAAERGEHEIADSLLKQFCEIRDRI